jgi:hypothetical protein
MPVRCQLLRRGGRHSTEIIYTRARSATVHVLAQVRAAPVVNIRGDAATVSLARTAGGQVHRLPGCCTWGAGCCTRTWGTTAFLSGSVDLHWLLQDFDKRGKLHREGQPRLETPPTTLLQPSPSARLDNLLQRGTQGTAAATGQPNTRAASRRPADVWRPPTMQAPRENPPAPRLPSAQAVANLLLFSRRRSPTGLGGSHGGGWPHVLHRPQQSGVY